MFIFRYQKYLDRKTDNKIESEADDKCISSGEESPSEDLTTALAWLKQEIVSTLPTEHVFNTSLEVTYYISNL